METFNWKEFADFFTSLNKDFDLRSLALNGAADFEKRVAALTLKVALPGEDTLSVDVSKQLIPNDALRAIVDFLQQRDFLQRLNAMPRHEALNFTEQRKVLHVALRDLSNGLIGDQAIVDDVKRVRDRIGAFVDRVHSGEETGYSGKRFRHFVSIGIGGSDLGPKMVCQALAPFALGAVDCHFISNVDATQLVEVLQRVDLEATLFGVCSKTFTTKETMTNARAVRALLQAHYGSDSEEIATRHFCALSTNLEETAKFGIVPERVFEFWNWVGGRFSLWSSIGISIVMQIGSKQFEEFLSGANCMDKHFFSTELSKNIPVIMGLVKLWNLNALRLQTEAIVPYDSHLELFTSFLQQLESESNGKTFARDGRPVELVSTAVLFGQPGTNGQHAFYQMIHQGQVTIPSVFFFARSPANLDQLFPAEAELQKRTIRDQHTTLVSNCIAQTEALMIGKSMDEVDAELQKSGADDELKAILRPAKSFAGNRPTTLISYECLSPAVLGALVALFEHQTFVTGLLAGINSFDQFGVELGKALANRVEAELRASDASAIGKHDASTANAMRFFLRQ